MYVPRGRKSRNYTAIWLWGTATEEVWHSFLDIYQLNLTCTAPKYGTAPHFVLSLHSNSVSSQIIYSTSRNVPFPSWLIWLGYYRYFNESWPCGWCMLKELTKDLCYNLYSATRMGDLEANLFLCHLFSVSSVLQSLCSGLPERTDIQVPMETQQCKSTGNL